MQGVLFFRIQRFAVVVGTPFGGSWFAPRAQGAGKLDCRVAKSTANIVNCSCRGSPYFIERRNICSQRSIVKQTQLGFVLLKISGAESDETDASRNIKTVQQRLNHLHHRLS